MAWKHGKKVALYGALLAVSLIIGYAEHVLTLDTGVPGVKVGLANAATLICLYLFTAGTAFTVNAGRVTLSSLIFGSAVSFAYSISGATVSFFMMYLAKKTKLFSVVGVSIIGGVFHNIGQLFASAVIMRSFAVFTYLPALIASGVIFGAVVGAVAKEAEKRLKPLLKSEQ